MSGRMDSGKKPPAPALSSSYIALPRQILRESPADAASRPPRGPFEHSRRQEPVHRGPS